MLNSVIMNAVRNRVNDRQNYDPNTCIYLLTIIEILSVTYRASKNRWLWNVEQEEWGGKLMWHVLVSLQRSPGNSDKRVKTPELN